MTEKLLRRMSVDQLPARMQSAVDAETLGIAAEIVHDVRTNGEAAIRAHAERLGDIDPGDSLWLTQADLAAALEKLDTDARALLERSAARIRRFAEHQMSHLSDMMVGIEGGLAGHDIRAVQSAGCYAPGGRFPLPSSVLMTAITARVAGVERVWVASPRPTIHTLAAAAIADVEGFLVVGGAQAIAAMAYGAGPMPRADIIVGPGNRFVTAAKKIVAGETAIDMLAGPSELVVLADKDAPAALIAADLLAQAEHDADAVPVLITDSEQLAETVEAELALQLADLPTAETARRALENGGAYVTGSLLDACRIADSLAPEHLEVMAKHPDEMARKLTNYGALFVGSASAEVLGDYAAGPNHVLPTGGTARFTGGLSVFSFLRIRTWMRMDEQEENDLLSDVAAFARLEGLEAHARAAEKRKKKA